MFSLCPICSLTCPSQLPTPTATATHSLIPTCLPNATLPPSPLLVHTLTAPTYSLPAPTPPICTPILTLHPPHPSSPPTQLPPTPPCIPTLLTVHPHSPSCLTPTWRTQTLTPQSTLPHPLPPIPNPICSCPRPLHHSSTPSLHRIHPPVSTHPPLLPPAHPQRPTLTHPSCPAPTHQLNTHSYPTHTHPAPTFTAMLRP